MKSKRNIIMIIVIIGIFLLCGVAAGGYSIVEQQQLRAKFEVQRMSSELCEGQITDITGAGPYSQTPGLHPVQVVEKSKAGNWLAETASNSRFAPWRPDELAKVELVACVDKEEVVLGNCQYSLETGASAEVIRMQWQGVVKLYAAQSGELLVTSEQFSGDMPAPCSDETQFEQGEYTKRLSGSDLDAEAIGAWLKAYVELP